MEVERGILPDEERLDDSEAATGAGRLLPPPVSSEEGPVPSARSVNRVKATGRQETYMAQLV